MILQTKNGYPEVILTLQCESAIFYTTADWLRHEIGISFCNKEKQDNMIYWQFYFGTGIAVLKYDPSSGISVCPAGFGNTTLEEKAAFKMLADTMAMVNVIM
jgi:hypothetical protein